MDDVLFVRNRKRLRKEYGGDLFPIGGAEAASGLTFLEFFQRDKLEYAKGIVHLDMRQGL